MGRLTVLIGLVLLAGCGGSDQQAGGGVYGAEYLEREIPNGVDRSLYRLTDVSCVKKSDRVFTCLAMAHPTAKGIREEYKSFGTPLSARDVALMRRQETQQVSYEVTVDPESGEFVFRAQ